MIYCARVDTRRDRAMRFQGFSVRLRRLPAWLRQLAVRVSRPPCSPRREIPAKSLFAMEKIAGTRRRAEKFPWTREFPPPPRSTPARREEHRPGMRSSEIQVGVVRRRRDAGD